MKLNDPEIRVYLHRYLERLSTNHGSVIRHEMGVDEGARRVDVAVLNGHFTGYEIKSDYDTLRRLEGQASEYDRVMDYMTLVTTARHLDKAVPMLPDHWGIMVVSQSRARIKGQYVRRPRFNRSTDSLSTAKLLWREEGLAILRKYGNAYGLSDKSRWLVFNRLVDSLPKRIVRRETLESLKLREDWPGGTLCTQDGDWSPRLATA